MCSYLPLYIVHSCVVGLFNHLWQSLLSWTVITGNCCKQCSWIGDNVNRLVKLLPYISKFESYLLQTGLTNNSGLLLDQKNNCLFYKFLKMFTWPFEFLLDFVLQWDIFHDQCAELLFWCVNNYFTYLLNLPFLFSILETYIVPKHSLWVNPGLPTFSSKTFCFFIICIKYVKSSFNII